MVSSMIVGMTAGFFGSLHCVAMCGGIISALSLSSTSGQRWTSPLIYSVGRVTTYVLLGIVFASFGVLVSRVFPIQRLLFISANVFLIVMGVVLLPTARPLKSLESIGYGLWRRVQPAAVHLTRFQNPAARFFCGMLWGFLPCSMIYMMLAQCVLIGDPVDAAAMMAAFGLSTMPAIVAVGWLGARLTTSGKRYWIQRIGGVLLIGYGVFGLSRSLPDSDAIVEQGTLGSIDHAASAPRLSSEHFPR